MTKLKVAVEYGLFAAKKAEIKPYFTATYLCAMRISNSADGKGFLLIQSPIPFHFFCMF